MTRPHEYFNSIVDYQKRVDKLKKNFFSKLKNACPSDEKIERPKDSIKKFINKIEEKITEKHLKGDDIFLADSLEKFIKVSIKEFDINPLCCISLLGYTWQCGLKSTELRLKTLSEKELILALENIFRGSISSVLSDRYTKSDENEKNISIDANDLYGHSMSQTYDQFKFDKNVEIEEILNTPDDSDIGSFFEFDLFYPNNKNENTENFPLAPENEKKFPVIFTPFLKENQIYTFTQTKKLICESTDKKKYLIHYRILKFFVRQGMVVESS